MKWISGTFTSRETRVTAHLKVNPGRAIRTNDHLELIIPAIRACPRLRAPRQGIRPTKEVLAQLRRALGTRIVQAHNEECLIYDVQAQLVRLVRLQRAPEVRPFLPILSRQDPHGRLGHFGGRGVVCVGDDGFQVGEDLPLVEQWAVLLVDHVEVVCSELTRSGNALGEHIWDMRLTELAPSYDHDVSRIAIGVHPTTVLSRRKRSAF